MMTTKTQHNWWAAPRGAALILVMLVMLVLSGLGLVAMHSTAEGTKLAGMHRLQSQSKSLSEAVNQLGVIRSGRQAPALHAQFNEQVSNALEPGAMRRGGYALFTTEFSEDGDGNLTGLGGDEVALQTDGGLFSRNDFVTAVDEDAVTFRYIVRDPVMGPPVPGFSDEYCFVGVSVGSSSNIGDGDADDDIEARARAKRRQALGRNISRAYIGPIECQ